MGYIGKKVKRLLSIYLLRLWGCDSRAKGEEGRGDMRWTKE